MGLFEKTDYDELYRKLSSEKMTEKELKKAKKLLEKLRNSDDRRGILWTPLISVQWKNADNAIYRFSLAESKLGLCEDYVCIRSLPIVFNFFKEEYECRPYPQTAVFIARAYEHGWGTEKNHEKAVEIIRKLESYPRNITFSSNSDLIKNAYKEITGKEFPAKQNIEPQISIEQAPEQIPDAKAKLPRSADKNTVTKRIVFESGSTYEGETLDGKQHGRGKYTWANGTVYEGEWIDGNRTGKGKYTYKSGAFYEGDFVDGKMEGKGRYVLSNGDVYEGDFVSDDFNGRGKYTWTNGNTYDGEWVDNKRTGHGLYTTYGKRPSDGGTYMKYSYDGEWVDNKEHGHGICVEGDFAALDPMNKVFEGEWVNGKRQGRFVWYFLHEDGEKGKSYIDFYENGNTIETCIPYSENIITVEDARIAKQNNHKSAAVSESDVVKHTDMSDIPSWQNVKSGKVKEDRQNDKERREEIEDLVYTYLHPAEFDWYSDITDRNIEESCLWLRYYIEQAEELFLDNKLCKSADRVGEILGVTFNADAEWIYDEKNKYFSDFLHSALFYLAKLEPDEIPDVNRTVVAAVNIACYMWKVYSVTDVLWAARFLWIEWGMPSNESFLWLQRVSENGDPGIRCSDSISEKYHGLDVDQYIMGSDCKLYDPRYPKDDLY